MDNLKHIAFIMDGNGRWAKEHNLPRHLGHKKGVENVITILKECQRLNIEVVSFYVFSTENWNRPEDEINHLFNYLELFFKRELKTMIELGIRIKISGDLTKLPAKTQLIVENSIEKTKDCKNTVCNFCLNYGGRDEIIRAIKRMNDSEFNINELNVDSFKQFLDTYDLPDVDLMIRTSGEQRISNYLLYELAYAEFIFNQKKWPEYSIEDLHSDIEIFKKRIRRFGAV